MYICSLIGADSTVATGSKADINKTIPIMNNIAHKTRCYSLALFMTLTLTAHGQAKWNDYAIRDSVVTYQGQALPNADVKSFVELGFGYAKDQYNVYAHGEVLKFADVRGQDNVKWQQPADIISS